MLSLFDQVEPAISKQVEFSNGYMHADVTWHEFTNKLITSEGKMTLSTPSQYLNMFFSNVLTVNLYGDDA